MTITAPRVGPAHAKSAPPAAGGHSATRRTLLALLAAALGAVPLKALLADNLWLVQAWLAMAIVIAPAALLRLRRAPSALDIWPGVVLLVPLLTALYVRHHAWGGLIPNRATFHDVSKLMTSLHHTTSDEVAPVHSTAAIRLVICALLGLLAALIDLIAVVGHRGALAGVPLLVVYTVSGAVPRSPVAWVWFSIAAVGYLILLALDAADEVRNWGRRVSGPGAVWRRQGLAFSAQRIGTIAIVVAVILPLLVPSHPRNLIADAFHKHGGSGLGNFSTQGKGTALSPFVELRSQLVRDHPIDLMKVHVDSDGSVQPFYVRSNVLDKFTGDGWRVSSHGTSEPIDETSFGTLPFSGAPRTVDYQVQITVTRLSGSPPVFSVPQSLSGVGADAKWSPQDQVVLGADVHSGESYTEVVNQPDPTIDDLEAAPSVSGADMARWLQLPALPDYVTKLVARLTGAAATPYDKAAAIFRYFTDPVNRFVYSLKTQVGDSGSALVDFLQHRTGFCQQYAAAMAVLLRAAGVPSRVVLGYMHPPTDASSNFTVSTFDAHSWVEAYFPNAGWIPFDPTPASGLSGGKKVDLPWARHSFASDGGPAVPTISTGARPHSSSSGPIVGPVNTAHGAGSSSPISGPLLLTLLVLLLVVGALLTPAGIRAARRRRRLRHGDADALWAELSDTAVDLGYVWSPARTPRQVSAWLAPDAAGTAPALDALAVAVERNRFAREPDRSDRSELTRGLRAVIAQLWSRRGGKVRLRARLWPASLGWGARVGGVRRAVLRRKH